MHGQHIKRRQTAFFNNLPSLGDVIPPVFPISFNYRCVQDAPDRYLEHPIQARSVYARWFSCYTSCRCAIQDADDFTGSFSPAASWLYSCRRSCTSCTLNSDPVFRRLPDGLFPMPYLGLAVHTIVSNLCPFLFVVLQFGSAAMSFRHIQTVIHAPVIYILYFSNGNIWPLTKIHPYPQHSRLPAYRSALAIEVPDDNASLGGIGVS